jgi:DNA polymerase III epsilon subunit-like protein
MKPQARDFLIVVDVEATGPTPDRYALIAIGAATLSSPQETFYIELEPDSDEVVPHSLAISGLDFDLLKKEGTPPGAGMEKFAAWVHKVTPEDSAPVMTAFNAPFDWMYLNVYFHRYLGYNPFGHKALDIKALYMGVHNVPFAETSNYYVSQHYGLPPEFTHNALEDAVQGTEILQKLLIELAEKEMK